MGGWVDGWMGGWVDGLALSLPKGGWDVILPQIPWWLGRLWL